MSNARAVLLATLISVPLGCGCARHAQHSPAVTTPPAAASETAPGIKSFAAPYPRTGNVEVLDPVMATLVDPGATFEVLAEGFDWSEGPVWVPEAQGEGYLLFTDVPGNVVYRWRAVEGVTVFMKPTGYHGDRADMKEPGSNGLALDAEGRLLMCQHGNRRVARLEALAVPQGAQTALAERFEGKRFNSPNDLCVHPTGTVFFTDPPYGLPRQADDPEKELPFQGVYRLDPDGKVALLSQELERPNGIALSPDSKTLYVANSDGARPIWMAFDLAADLGVSQGRVLFDATELAARTGRKGGNDGLAVDRAGHLFATGPGGVVVLTPDGRHLGTLLTGGLQANCKFGGDGATLYVTANDKLLRIKTRTSAAR
jgi:gluconolactonase